MGTYNKETPGFGYLMKILSFNYSGLTSPTKKSSLKRLVSINSQDTIFLQETLGVSEVVVKYLESFLPGWLFVAVDAKGRLGGLATGCRLKSGRRDSIWGFDSGIGLNLFS